MASGICIDDNQAKNAIFKFDILLSMSPVKIRIIIMQLTLIVRLKIMVSGIELVYVEDGSNQILEIGSPKAAGSFRLPSDVGRSFVLKIYVEAKNNLDGMRRHVENR